MNVLASLYRPEEGEVKLHGTSVVLRSPRDAIARGVSMVHQQLMLVPPLTVAENALLGIEQHDVLRPKEGQKRVAALSLEHGLKVDPSAFVGQLSIGEQQRVELLKTLARGGAS